MYLKSDPETLPLKTHAAWFLIPVFSPILGLPNYSLASGAALNPTPILHLILLAISLLSISLSPLISQILITPPPLPPPPPHPHSSLKLLFTPLFQMITSLSLSWVGITYTPWVGSQLVCSMSTFHRLQHLDQPCLISKPLTNSAKPKG